MQRRLLVKLGLACAALVAILGGTAGLTQPGFTQRALTAAGRDVFGAIAASVLDKTLPEQPAARQAAVTALLSRIDALINSLPDHAQAEVSQLLSILATGAGRRALTGLGVPWLNASVQEVQTALQSMRLSGLAVRQQAYAALHDITTGAYFSDPDTWGLLGYPGPLAI
jgi:hypothetical protein